MSSNAGSPSAMSAASPPSHTPAPPILSSRPSLCMKPLPTAASPPVGATSPPASLTSKEWIVPPRPKPGRKPATDTPPTKRKAQNRAAQRAFRERRAARVGELEEQMKQVEDEHEQQHEAMKVNIAKLEQEVEQYRNDLTLWIEKCRQLEKELAEARRSKGEISTTSGRPSNSSNEVVGCGNCTLDTRCQCIDDAFNAMTGGSSDGEPIQSERRTVPSVVVDTPNKRIKAEPSDSMEIDFTAMYSKPTNSTMRNHAVSPSSAMADPCGFCQDGTPCICAEMAAEQERAAAPRHMSPMAIQRHTTRQLAQFTPPPSEGDVTNPATAASSGCASGPGTCAQCQADPNSTLFCKSLAASRAQSGVGSSGGCCGGKGADGGCCRSQSSPRSTRLRATASSRQLPPLEAPRSSITLTCADAYTTLSRHPAYERASGEIATWMPKLYANPSDADGRPAMEIDAANVMAVLRDFDRRFGADR